MKPQLFLPAFTLSLLLTSCHWFSKEEIKHPVEKRNESTLIVRKEALENLKISRVTMSDFPEKLYLMGKIGITEDRTTVIPSRVSGRIEAIYLASGESVTKGQVLASLFSPDFLSAKEEYLLSVRQAKNKSGSADPSDFSNLAQMSRKKLLAMGLNNEDIDSLSAGGTEASDKAAEKSEHLRIRAPRDGVIIAKNAVIGNLVNVGDALFTIGDLSKVWFAGDIYPEDLSKIKKDQEVVIQVTGSQEAIYGKVSFISPIVDPISRSIKIRALMDNPKGLLKGDMYVQGSVTLRKSKTLLLPTNSIIRTPLGDSVFKKIQAQTSEGNLESIEFKKVMVQIGKDQEGLTAVTAGLVDGDEVVSEGAWLLDSVLNSSDATDSTK